MTIDNVIDPMSRPAFPQPAYPPAALPIATFDTRMQLHFNGQLIDLLHVGPGHTTGDAAVIFRDRNAVHMGDLFLPQGYPFVDVDNGGSIDGLITSDRRFRAFDSSTGLQLWEATLDTNVNANPMTYLGRDGKQYVAAAVGERLVAFALP